MWKVAAIPDLSADPVRTTLSLSHCPSNFWGGKSCSPIPHPQLPLPAEILLSWQTSETQISPPTTPPQESPGGHCFLDYPKSFREGRGLGNSPARDSHLPLWLWLSPPL